MSGVKVHVVQNQFGQAALKQILIDLGGKATSQQLSAEAKARYPDSKLCEVVSIRLNHMRNWGEVFQQRDKKTGVWYWCLKEQRA